MRAFLEGSQFEHSKKKNKIDFYVSYVIEAWQIMGNRIDWEALPAVGEMIGICEYEEFIQCLLAIRKFNQERDSFNRN